VQLKCAGFVTETGTSELAREMFAPPLAAAFGPLFVTSIVYVRLLPGMTGSGESPTTMA
jgi:hypothetical protein